MSFPKTLLSWQQSNDGRLKERIQAMTDEQLAKMLLDDPRDWTPEALAFAKAELEARRGKPLSSTEYRSGPQSEFVARVESVLRRDLTEEDCDFRDVEAIVVHQTIRTASRGATMKVLESRGLPSQLAAEAIDYVHNSPRARKMIAEKFGKRAGYGVILLLVGTLLTVMTGGKYLFYGAIGVGLVWSVVGLIFWSKWNGPPSATGGERRLRKAIEAQVRQEHEPELSATTEYWQKIAIEKEIEHEIRERMKRVASPHSL